MKNALIDLQNNLFEMMEMLMDKELDTVEDKIFKRRIDRSMAFGELSKIAVTNGALMVKAADTLYGLPVSDQLPLIPPSPSENPVLVDGKRKSLINIPKGDFNYPSPESFKDTYPGKRKANGK